MADKNQTQDVNKTGRAALAKSAPPALKRAIGGVGNVNFVPSKNDVVAAYSGNLAGGAISGVDRGNPNTVNVMDQGKFAVPRNTGQLAVHEAMHIVQNNLPPKVQQKIPADNPSDPYNFGGDQGLIQSRQKGQTLLDKPREQQAAILQTYTAKNDDYRQKVQNGTATPADHAANAQLQQTYGPWVNDLNHMPQSVIMPTDPQAKGNTIVTTPRVPAAPPTDTPGMNFATEVVPPSDPQQGVSTPPDNGNVSDTGFDASSPTDSPAPQTEQPQTTAQVQGQPNPAAMQLPAQQTQQKQPADMSQHPAVKRASLLNDIATALSGGPRYKTTIDPNTGDATRTQVPLSRGQVGLAIALEAISGGLAGLSAKGTNATGQAAAAGLQQGQQAAQKVQQQNQQQDQQANTDYAHHAQTLETNMRLANNAMQVSRMNDEANDAYVAQFAPLADNVMKNYSSIVQGVVSEQDLQKYHVAKDSAIPYQKVPRIDPNTGEQMKNASGQPLWDHNYIVIDPKFKADDLLTPEDKATAAKYHLNGFVNGKGEPTNLPQNLTMKLGSVMNLKSQIGSLQLGEHDLNDYYKTNNATTSGANTPVWSMFGDTGKLADFITSHEGGKPGDRNTRNNNPGNLIATSANQKQDKDGFRIFDTAAEGRDALEAQLKRDQQRYPNYTPEQYFAKYSPDGGKGNKPGTSEAYAAEARKAAGAPALGDQAENEVSAPDLAKAIAQDPTLTKAMTSFQALLNATADKKTGEVSYGSAIAQMAANDPAGAGKIAALYGGKDQMIQHDQMVALQREAAVQQVKDNQALAKTVAERLAKEGETSDAYQADAKVVAGSKDDPGSEGLVNPTMLISQRTADRPKFAKMVQDINPNWNWSVADEKNKMIEDYSSGKTGQAAQSFNQFLGHTGDALDESNGYLRSSLGTDINKPFTAVKNKYTGDPHLAAFETSLEPAANEFVTFLNNNHALHDSDKALVSKLSDPNQSIAVKEATLKQMALTAAIRMRAMNNTWMKTFRTPMPGLVDPQSVEVIKKLADEHGNNQVADTIGALDTGGSILGSVNGRGKPGTTVSEALGRGVPKEYTQAPKKGELRAANGSFYLWNGSNWENRSGGNDTLPANYFNQQSTQQTQQTQQANNQQPNQPQANEKPVIVNGQTIGYTVDGKTLSRLAQ